MLANLGGTKVVMDVPSEMEKRGYNPVSKSVFSIDKLKGLGWTVSENINEKIRKTVEHLCMQL